MTNPYGGKGYATELAQYDISTGFTQWHTTEMFALVRPNNLASKILEKCGMQCFSDLDNIPHEAPSLVYRIGKR